MSIARVCVQRPVAAGMVFAAFCVVGLASLLRLPVELMPNAKSGDISVMVDVRGGMPPEEVESMIAKPIEDAVGDVAALKDVVSISEEGRCRVSLKFEPGTDMDYAALDVRERISRIKSALPKEADRPIVAKFDQNDAPIYIVALSSSMSVEKLRRLADERIKERLLRVDGVAQVEIGGGRERKIIIDVDEARIAAQHLPLRQIVEAIGNTNLTLLVGEVNRSEDSPRLLVRVDGAFTDVASIGETLLPLPGRTVRLKDVATVRDSYLKAKSFARVNAEQVVSLYVQKESSANTIKVCAGVRRALADVARDEEFSKLGISSVVTQDQSQGIQRAISSVQGSLMWGAIFSSMILLLFLREAKALAVITAVMPVSLLLTCAMMYAWGGGLTLNVMTLSGLALGVGMLLDNAVVVTENILAKRVHHPLSPERVADAADEMMLAIVASTLTSVSVFIPIIFVNPEIKILYGGFAFVICASLGASLLAAVSLVPMMGAQFFCGTQETQQYRAFSGMYTQYRRLLMRLIRFRFWVIASIGFVCVIAFLVFTFAVPREFIGTAQQDDFTAFVELPTGAKIGISDDAVKALEQVLRKVPEVKTISSRVEPWSSKVYVTLKALKDRHRSTEQVIESLRGKVRDIEKKFKDSFIYFEQPQQVESNEVLVEIYGHDYQKLSDLAVKMLSAAEKVKGLTDLKIRWRKGRPEWRVIVDRQKAAMVGLTVEDVAQQLHARVRGLRATAYHDAGKEVEVITRLREDQVNALGELKKIRLDAPGNVPIVLEQVASFTPSIGPGKIWRKNKNRMIQISADRGSLSFGEAVAKMDKVFADVEYPKDYFYRFGDNFERMQRNGREVTGALILMLVLMYLVLASLFESYTQPILLMASVPMAFVGSAAVLVLFHKSLNLGVLMGLLFLGGIAVNNAIVLLDSMNRLAAEGVPPMTRVLKGAAGRLRPVLITSCTTVLGMLPLALDRSEDAALWAPLALTVIGGMFSSTALTLVAIPLIYLLAEDIRIILVRR